MASMKITPVHNETALLAPDIDALIVADLHIGIEFQLFEAGARMPSGTDELKKRLLQLITDTGVGRLIILGDVKHKVPLHSFQEERELPKFFEEILDTGIEIHVTPGNHDGGLKDLVPKEIKIHNSPGFALGDYGMWHGHAWPSKKVMAADLQIFSHYHPVTLFVDNLGTRATEKCWVRGKWDKESLAATEKYDMDKIMPGKGAKKGGGQYIMMPAFNPLCGGTYINEERSWFGVVMRNKLLDLKNSEMYLLDGTNVGKVGDNLLEVERKWMGRGSKRHSKRERAQGPENDGWLKTN